jgi:hypothetical protein
MPLAAPLGNLVESGEIPGAMPTRSLKPLAISVGQVLTVPGQDFIRFLLGPTIARSVGLLIEIL